MSARNPELALSDEESTAEYENEWDSIAELSSAEKVTIEFPNDTWGVGIAVLVKDLADILDGHGTFDNSLRLGFSLFFVVLNLVLQIAILIWVNAFVVLPYVDGMQSDYKSFHQNVFSPDGTFLPDNWDKWPDAKKDSLCQTGMTRLVFLGAVLFLWAMRMLGEARSVLRLHRSLDKLPDLPPDGSPDDMVSEVPGDDGVDDLFIICINRTSRISIYVFVLIPKLGIALYLLFSGCKWLTATESFSDLILNALALEFIVSIDELLFESAFPESMVSFCEHMYLAPCKSLTPQTKKEKAAAMRKDYYRSMFLCTVVIVFVVTYLTMFQQVLPGYNNYQDLGERCRVYFDETFQTRCTSFTVWPFNTNDCFEYGQAEV